MSNPQTDPPPPPADDPDKDLTPEQLAERDRFKRWVGDAFRDTITALKAEETPPPERTKKPSGPFSGTGILGGLFGGATGPSNKE